MIKYIFLSLLWVPLGLMGQSSAIQSLDKSLNEGWTTLDEGWTYNKGDNLYWAQPNYDDKQWKPVVAKDNGNINWVDNRAIAGKNEIVWFRKKIKIEASFKESIIFTVSELGASEIYLDGKLLNKFGEPSNLDSAHKKAWDDIFVLPMVPGKEQLLAIRYTTGNWDFPIYNGSRGIGLRLTTLSVLNSPKVSLNNRLALMKVGQKYFDISLGATSLISILFFTLFLFFPKEKINGFFALSTFFLSLFLISGSMESSMVSNTFWLNIFTIIAMYIGLLLMLFCVYRIFKRSLGFWFWTLCLLFFLGLVSSVVYPISYFAFILLLYQFAIILLSIRALKTHGVAARIFISCMGLIFIYFISNVILQAFGVDTTTSDVYFSGLSFMLLPLSIAIYLGYNFSQRSKSLASQLVEVKRLSTENTRILSEQKNTLEKEVTLRTKELNTSLENLKATQGQLIQSEKMASLGELTAGIAHEIQNPLNFVNNFSEVNVELIDEMQDELKTGNHDEVIAISNDIKENQKKINHHGKRADSIVKGMLKHSRNTSGEKEPTNINAIADEYLRLAYHGLRAKDKTFNATLNTDFDESLSKINVVPQDIGRVILNLITNALHAISPKVNTPNKEPDKTPTIWLSTKQLGDHVFITVKDNGSGIPKDILDKIFQPFFTTKASGEGTGLGLSMSYDIIKSHGGELKVESKEGEGTTFTIDIPQ